MSDDGGLTDILIEWEERKDRGDELLPQQLCRDRPELLPALEEEIRLLKLAAWMKRQTTERDAKRRWAERAFRVGEEVVPGYRLIQMKGRGQFGEVWAASVLDGPRRDGLVAVKFIHGSLDVLPSRLHAEVELEGVVRIQGVSHPHVLEVVRALVRGPNLLVITELADRSLEEHFGVLPPDWTTTRRCLLAAILLWGVAEALDHIQTQHGLMHLDVKPANLLMVGRQCKLADFGSVKRLRASGTTPGEVLLAQSPGSDPDVTGTLSQYRTWQDVPWEAAMHPEATLYTAVGAFTPHYASPEMLHSRASRASDQYSLAMTFCQVTVGAIPFSGNRDEQIEQRLQGCPQLGPLPEAFRPAVAKALSPKPEDRFACCADFINALLDALPPKERLRAGPPVLPEGTPHPVGPARDIAGRHSSATVRRHALTSQSQAIPAQEAKAKSQPQKRAAILAVVILVVVLLAPAVLGYFILRWAAWLVGKVLMPQAAHPRRGQRAEHRLVCALLLIPALIPAMVLYRCVEGLAPPPAPPDNCKEETPEPRPAKVGTITNPFSRPSDKNSKR